MKALLIAATVSALALAACSKQEETPAQAPAAEQTSMESLKPIENQPTANETQEPMLGLTASTEEAEKKDDQASAATEPAMTQEQSK